MIVQPGQDSKDIYFRFNSLYSMIRSHRNVWTLCWAAVIFFYMFILDAVKVTDVVPEPVYGQEAQGTT